MHVFAFVRWTSEDICIYCDICNSILTAHRWWRHAEMFSTCLPNEWKWMNEQIPTILPKDSNHNDNNNNNRAATDDDERFYALVNRK